MISRLMLALLSGGVFGFVTFWISVWILEKIDRRWPSNDLTGKGLPSGCSLLILFILAMIAASVGFCLVME